MGEVGEVFRAVKLRSKGRRAQNRAQSALALKLRGIPFLNKNGGAHLIVNSEHVSTRVDYWPGTGLWRSYWGSKEGRGLDSLLRWLDE